MPQRAASDRIFNSMSSVQLKAQPGVLTPYARSNREDLQRIHEARSGGATVHVRSTDEDSGSIGSQPETTAVGWSDFSSPYGRVKLP